MFDVVENSIYLKNLKSKIVKYVNLEEKTACTIIK